LQNKLSKLIQGRLLQKAKMSFLFFQVENGLLLSIYKRRVHSDFQLKSQGISLLIFLGAGWALRDKRTAAASSTSAHSSSLRPCQGWNPVWRLAPLHLHQANPAAAAALRAAPMEHEG